MTVPRVVVVLGAGEIGSGWAALFAAYGAEVRVVDPSPRALAHARESLEIARSLLARWSTSGALPVAPGLSAERGEERGGERAVSARAVPEVSGEITSASLADAVSDAEWIQESLPERIDLKREALAGLEGHLADGAIVASSTSTLTASVIAEGFSFAPRLMVAHPLNPVYAVPIVELSAGRLTESAALKRAVDALRALGREPVIVRGEPPGLVANRLTAALLREALELVANGVVDPSSIDRIVAHGIATGWAAVGPFATEKIGRRGAASAAINERMWAESIARILDAANVRVTPGAPWSGTPPPRDDSP